MNDYPNESDALHENGPWSVEKPEERVEAEQKENEKVSSSIAVVQDVLDWLDGVASDLSSVDSLAIDDSTPDDQVKLAVLLSKRMRVAFQSKSMQFRTEFAKHLKEEADKT